jgi:hypothetical protein
VLKKISKLSLLLSLSFVTSCAGLPPDEPLCTEITIARGFCVRMMSGQTFEVNDDVKLNGKTWWDMKPTMVYMPASTWAALKKWIIKTCKNNSQCDSAVASWDRTVEIIDDNVNP